MENEYEITPSNAYNEDEQTESTEDLQQSSRIIERIYLREYDEVRQWLVRFLEEVDEIEFEYFPYKFSHEKTPHSEYDRLMLKIRKTALLTFSQVKRALTGMKSLSKSNIIGWRKRDNEADFFLSWYRQEYERFFDCAKKGSNRICKVVTAL